MEPLLAAVGAALLLFGLLGLFAAASPWVVTLHLALGGALLLYAAARRLPQLLAVAGGASGKSGANALIQTLSLCAIAGLLAFLAARNSVSWDWTEAKVHTLSAATTDVLEHIPAEQRVEILAFYARGGEREARPLLDLYAAHGDRVRVQYYDPNERPELAQRHEIRSEQGAVVVCGGPCDTAKGTVKLPELSENELTKAIRSVISTKRKVYVLTGHGEAGLDDDKAEGFAAMRGALQNENYEVSELLLADQAAVPDDADALLVVGPTHSLFPAEQEALDRYLRKGGGLALLLDPMVVSGLDQQVRKWGIALDDDVVVDEQLTLFSGPQLGVNVIVANYGQHPITDKLKNQVTLFPMARSLRAADGVSPPPTELVITGPRSWGETDTRRYVDERVVGRDPNADRMGPMPLAMAATLPAQGDGKEGEGSEGRLVVVGNSHFARNRYVSEGYNADLFLNMVSWLAGQEEFATIERKLPRASSSTMTWEQFANFRFASLFLLPEFILLAAIFGWWRRRS
jgi:ABC-type uncharacterized transport system involved in gliding motility auxiliary subunit